MSDITSLSGGGGYGGGAPHGGGRKVTSMDQILAETSQTMSQHGGAPLPARDIPMGSIPQYQIDPATQPNYAGTTLLQDSPSATHPSQRYIEQREMGGGGDGFEGDYEDNVEQTASHKSVNLEDTYNKLQAPIFLAVLFFIFQLPLVKKWEYNYIPFAFTSDGNLNAGGIAINSVVFGLIYFVLQKLVLL